MASSVCRTNSTISPHTGEGLASGVLPGALNLLQVTVAAPGTQLQKTGREGNTAPNQPRRTAQPAALPSPGTRTAHELNASSGVCLEQRWVPKETRRDCLGSPTDPPTSGPHTQRF